MGGWHFLLTQLMAGLQGLEISEKLLLTQSVQQAVLFPLIWALVYNLFKRKVPDVCAI